MKIKLRSFLLINTLLITTLCAQTTIESGDVAVIYHLSETTNSSQGITGNVDRIGLVLLKDITANTTFKISENGTADGTSLESDEGIITFTAQTNHIAGTVIDLVSMDQLDMGITSNIPLMTDFNPGTDYAIGTSGDQTMIYTGSESSPTFIYSAFFDGTSWDIMCSGINGFCSSTQSVEPSSGITFAFGSGLTDEFDTNWYIGPTNFNNPAEALVAITNVNNWTGENNNTGAGETAADALVTSGFTFGALSLDEISIVNKLNVYPNPSEGIFTIKNPGVPLQNIQVVDVNGRIVSDINLNNTMEDEKLDLQLLSGMYFVRISSQDAIVIKKLMVK